MEKNQGGSGGIKDQTYIGEAESSTQCNQANKEDNSEKQG
jgi:hypothetical protein